MRHPILVTAPLPDFLYGPLKSDYRCHDYVQAADKPALLASEGATIRGLVQGGGTITPTTLLDALPALEQGIQAVDATGLHVSIVPAGEEPPTPGTPLSFELVGQDRPGIVREVTTVLARLGVNIEDFATATENSSWSGEPLFKASARLTIPAGTSAEDVRAALEAISGEIMVDFTITPTQA